MIIRVAVTCSDLKKYANITKKPFVILVMPTSTTTDATALKLFLDTILL